MPQSPRRSFAILAVGALLIAGLPFAALPVADASQCPVAGCRTWESTWHSAVDWLADTAVSPNGLLLYSTGHAQQFYGVSSYATIAQRTSDGALVWSALYAGSSKVNEAEHLAVSPNGARVFVTGLSQSADDDIATVAYNALTGAQLWSAKFSAAGHDTIGGIIVSPDNAFVYVTGTTVRPAGSSSSDVVTIAYHASNGTMAWTSFFAGSGGGTETVADIGMLANGTRLFVTGSALMNAPTVSYMTIALDAATGNIAWASTPYPSRYHGSMAIAVEGGRAFTTGREYFDDYYTYVWRTYAYDAWSGAILWNVTRLETTSQQFEVTLKASPDRVIVAGRYRSDAMLIAYAAATGVQQWVTTHDAGGSEWLQELRITSDGSKAITVSDIYRPGGFGWDISTLVVNTTTGAVLGNKLYDSPGHGTERVRSLSVAPSGSAYYAGGQTGSDFVTVAYSMADLPEPSSPTNVAAVPGNVVGSINISWGAPSTTSGLAVSAYHLYRASGPDPLAPIADLSASARTYVDTGRTTGVTYRYAVSAETEAGEGARSAEATTRPPSPPSSPREFTGAPGDALGVIDLSWSPPAVIDLPITSHRLYRGVDGGSLALLAVLGAGNSTFTDTQRPTLSTWYYSISAVNAAGEGPQTAPMAARPPGPPPPPRNLVTSVGSAVDEVDISWTAPASSDLPLTSYRVYGGAAPEALVLLADVGLATTYTQAGLTTGETYYYAVTATNEAGEGTQTTAVAGHPPEPPSAPLDVSAQAGPGRGHIKLAWAAPAQTDRLPLTGFRIYRAEVGGTPSLLATVAGADRALVDGVFGDGDRYDYAVSAVTEAGEGTLSPVVTGTAPVVPSAPRDLTASPSVRPLEVLLGWAAPESTGGIPPIEYMIDRSEDGGETWTRITSLSRFRTTYTDTGLTPLTNYHYRLFMTNVVGDGRMSNSACTRAGPWATAPEGMPVVSDVVSQCPS